MADQNQQPGIQQQATVLADWAEVNDHLGSFPPPKVDFDQDGDLRDAAWIFRGVSDATWELEPRIEHYAKGGRMRWAALETKVSEEFRRHAPVRLEQPLASEDEMTWLALMQHYGAPTRLLDFTFSPFVALYFAARDCRKRGKHARVWAIDSQAINSRCREVVWRAQDAERERRGENGSGRVSLNPDDFASDRDVLKRENLAMQRRAEFVLAATGTFRAELNRLGCVCVALPPSFNPRLANQQGVFLFNGAEDLQFFASLERMMEEQTDWCRRFDIPEGLLSEIETQLFQMNIHEQSLFPDMHGLAGLIKQRIRLHWT